MDDRSHVHPVLGTVLQACKAFGQGFAVSPMLVAFLRAHVGKLGLRLLSVQGGLWVAPAAATDDRVRHAARRARLQGTRNFPPEAARVATAFQADESPGRHAARICASVKALKGVHSSRYDAEGVARTLTWKLSLTSPAKNGRNASHRKRRNS